MRRGSIDPAQATRKGWPYYTRAARPIDGGGQGSYIVGPPLAGGLGLGPTGGLGPGLTGGLGPIGLGPGLTGGLGPGPGLTGGLGAGAGADGWPGGRLTRPRPPARGGPTIHGQFDQLTAGGRDRI